MKYNELLLTSASQEMKKLKVHVRNKVRAIICSKEDEAVSILNKLRKSSSVGELTQIEKVIRIMTDGESVLPESFPTIPQTSNNYQRLSSFELNKMLSSLNSVVRFEFIKVTLFFGLVLKLNNKIKESDFEGADSLIGEIVTSFGYSHFILRKAVLIKSFAEDDDVLLNINGVISESGFGYNNIVSSLIHCYQEEQDFLSIKRSLMSTKDLGSFNRFNRDMLRLSVHPHAKDESDLSEMIQSNLQSSLVDAVLIAKINKNLFEVNDYPHLNDIFSIVDDSSLTIDCIANNYLNFEDTEELFYQQSSAWYENEEVIRYRVLQDHFYNSPDANYFDIDEGLISRLSGWVNVKELGDLVDSKKLTSHNFSVLRSVELAGNITRSSIFNYIVHINKGQARISENELVRLMGVTSDLYRTVNVEFLKVLSSNVSSDVSKIILYLLVAKKSKNEMDGYKLRRLIQNKVLSKEESKLVDFIDEISKVSPAVAEYTYDVCTEDFISKLSHIIKTAQAITETRASLHRWMGGFKGEKSYIERARNLIIDHQINLVKDELDDNRIYVDTARFTEWMEDEVVQELNTLLLILEHNNELTTSNEPQLFSILEKCFYEFCSNKYFGIASYLGRRIRHGTFKGHLYSDVVSIESEFPFLKSNMTALHAWEKWKVEHEKRVDSIVIEKLHIETTQKKSGFLNPNIRSNAKVELANSCMRDILKEFKVNRQVQGSLQIIAEYCWRIAEVDLRGVNSYLKSQKQVLMNTDFLSAMKLSSHHGLQMETKDFSRELQRLMSDKLVSMYGWFKRPLSVSPKASLSLLYKAVVAEVKQTFREFNPVTDFDDSEDIEIMGGAYHLLYDALYVIVYNAAKHGRERGLVERSFEVIKDDCGRLIMLTISSENNGDEDESVIRERLKVPATVDIDDAQLHEGRSGIIKLHNLEKYDKYFNIEKVLCENGRVTISVSYRLEHG